MATNSEFEVIKKYLRTSRWSQKMLTYRIRMKSVHAFSLYRTTSNNWIFCRFGEWENNFFRTVYLQNVYINIWQSQIIINGKQREVIEKHKRWHCQSITNFKNEFLTSKHHSQGQGLTLNVIRNTVHVWSQWHTHRVSLNSTKKTWLDYLHEYKPNHLFFVRL